MNLANKLTVLRIIMVPIFLVFISIETIPYGVEIATGIFILAALTDKLDGYIARSRNMITDFGKFMDPLADKLLVTAALVALTYMRIIPAWIVVVIISREFAVSGLRTLAANKGVVIAASWWGKIKTVIQFCAIILALINIVMESTVLASITSVAIYAAAIITLISGWDYFAKNSEVIASK
ncbi:CDP-diacylglycerol--glycerol-3-phosphate 3-phosphatidyltransferase [Oceanirhabdus sp. W0125-5]|uniref:CDP-diacylglycerol--glycerol-3-phosphate 3-phosphatidyltransferase n=1 Tax=Oceanirhabdus sp. W0125-5 TaxID=2999116 RepID=UPI0022F3176C|nr:CDP-diacylglycerol--glycerol-3-phosphate 3-phosphatidyltransferase [Oceanirhabdus sp. W0125-5]WBW94847.1 CDP-diacylglycerol--glycerol-3-phosphate 3-phosphatidyltransferase [Oceanirhabdus sp. W0125-5]